MYGLRPTIQRASDIFTHFRDPDTRGDRPLPEANISVKRSAADAPRARMLGKTLAKLITAYVGVETFCWQERSSHLRLLRPDFVAKRATSTDLDTDDASRQRHLPALTVPTKERCLAHARRRQAKLSARYVTYHSATRTFVQAK